MNEVDCADHRWEVVQQVMEEHDLSMTGRIHNVGVIVRVNGVEGCGLTLLEATERAVRLIMMPEVEA